MKIVRKLVLSVIALICVSVCFAASTYAWFDINSRAQVSGFDFQAMSGEGFLVSVDGVNYSNDLTKSDITKAIILGYNNEKYALKDEKIVYISSELEVPKDEIDSILRDRIAMIPRTSRDGINLEDLYSAASTPSSGSFLEFSIYFKATSSNSVDNFEYNIYLLGKEVTQIDGKVVKPTTIESVESTKVELRKPMNTINGPLYANDVITVYSSNAMRMSIQDTSLEEPKATIYELTNAYDLGSYATDYNKETDTSDLADTQKAELDKLYNAETNAMFTYYNNLRPNAMIDKLPYAQKPETIRSLMGDDLPVVTTVKSGSDAKLVTFRFWLEGWDADCFDGLAKSISVQLSFQSKLISDPTKQPEINEEVESTTTI